PIFKFQQNRNSKTKTKFSFVFSPLLSSLASCGAAVSSDEPGYRGHFGTCKAPRDGIMKFAPAPAVDLCAKVPRVIRRLNGFGRFQNVADFCGGGRAEEAIGPDSTKGEAESDPESTPRAAKESGG